MLIIMLILHITERTEKHVKNAVVFDEERKVFKVCR